jgi:hypothetical protein
MRAMLSALVVLAVTGCSLNPQPLPPDAPDAAGAVTDNPGADGGKPSQKTDASFDNEGGAGGGSDGGDANEVDSDAGLPEGGGDGATGDAANEAGPGDGAAHVDGSEGDAALK